MAKKVSPREQLGKSIKAALERAMEDGVDCGTLVGVMECLKYSVLEYSSKRHDLEQRNAKCN